MLDFNRVIGEVRALGGEVYGVVAQGQPAADTAKQTWRIDFPMIADPQVRIGETLAGLFAELVSPPSSFCCGCAILKLQFLYFIG